MKSKGIDKQERAPEPTEEEHLSRRELLQVGGIVLAGAMVGCSGGSSSDPDASGDADGAGDADLSQDDADIASDADEPGDAGLDADEVADADADADVDVDEGPAVLGPLFVLHLTDTHIGGHDLAAPALEHALSETVGGVDPALTVATGDLVDEGYHDGMWSTYTGITAVTTSDRFMEVPGNHDAHDDFSHSNYLRNSLTGDATARTWGHRIVEAAGRRVRFIGVNTASGGDEARNLPGYLEGSQVDNLIESIDSLGETVDATVILGHHPMTGINSLTTTRTADHLRRLIDFTGASAYLFGHVHLFSRWWNSDTLHVQGPTLGKPNIIGPAGFCLLALDDDGPVVRRFSFDVSGTSVATPWPLVLITRPSDARLGRNNPWSPVLPRSTPGQLLRAGVFSAPTIHEVNWRVGGGAWAPMTAVEGWYEAEFETTDAASMNLEVNALVAGGGSDTHTVTVELE